MKYMRIIFLLLVLTACCFSSYSQQNEVAQKIAQKMKDSLSLTTSQQQQLYAINIQLHEQKMTARQQGGNPNVIGVNIQRIENSRDSLYKPVLTDQQFVLYRQKKKYLISNN